MPELLCCQADCAMSRNVEVPIDDLQYPLTWYCEAHRGVTMFQSNTLRIDAGADLEIKPSPHEAEIKKLREALEAIVAICSTWTAHDPVIKIREIARKALKKFKELEKPDAKNNDE